VQWSQTAVSNIMFGQVSKLRKQSVITVLEALEISARTAPSLGTKDTDIEQQ